MLNRQQALSAAHGNFKENGSYRDFSSMVQAPGLASRNSGIIIGQELAGTLFLRVLNHLVCRTFLHNNTSVHK